MEIPRSAAPSSTSTEPNDGWRNAVAEGRLKMAQAHLDRAAEAELTPPALLAIDAARMHLAEAQSYLRRKR